MFWTCLSLFCTHLGNTSFSFFTHRIDQKLNSHQNKGLNSFLFVIGLWWLSGQQSWAISCLLLFLSLILEIFIIIKLVIFGWEYDCYINLYQVILITHHICKWLLMCVNIYFLFSTCFYVPHWYRKRGIFGPTLVESRELWLMSRDPPPCEVSWEWSTRVIAFCSVHL